VDFGSIVIYAAFWSEDPLPPKFAPLLSEVDDVCLEFEALIAGELPPLLDESRSALFHWELRTSGGEEGLFPPPNPVEFYRSAAATIFRRGKFLLSDPL